MIRIFLYNIPQVSGVTISIDLVNRLKKEFSDVITGIKDSSGNFENTKKYKEIKNFIVYPGSEKFLYDGLHIGCSGCISATTNVNIEASKLINSFDKILIKPAKHNKLILFLFKILKAFFSN